MEDKVIETLLFEFASKEYDNILDNEIADLDKDILALNFDVPFSFTQKLSKKCGLNLKSRYKHNTLSKRLVTAAVIAILTTGISISFIVTQPKAVIAIKNFFGIYTVQNSDDAIGFEIRDFNGYSIDLPEGFGQTEAITNSSFIRYRYENANDDYVEISIYSASYNLYLDNEYEKYEDIEINGESGELYKNNSLITLVYRYGNNIIEVESNLPETGILQVAESINFN